MRDQSTLDFLAITDSVNEDWLLQCCSEVLAEQQQWQNCYFDRYRIQRSNGVVLHFQPQHFQPRLLEDIVARARLKPNSAVPRFLTIVDDVRGAVGDVFGGVESIATFRTFSFDCAPLLWRWVGAGLGQPDKRLAVAAEVLVDYMYRMRAQLEGNSACDYPKLFISFRSHFEGFTASLEDPASAERAFAPRYDVLKSRLVSLTAAYEKHAGIGAPPWLNPWQTLSQRYFDSIHQLVLNESLVTGATTNLKPSNKNILASKFQEKIVSSKEYTQHAMKQPLFQTNRILLGLVYLSLFRLGLPLIERYFLCYSLSRFIEERHGVSAEQAFDDSVKMSARKRRWFSFGKSQ
jgi:hypothetical protein